MTTQPKPIDLITQALAQQGLPVGTALRVHGPDSYASPPITVRDDAAGLHASIDPPDSYYNNSDGWQVSVPVEVVVKHDDEDPERLTRLHDAIATAMIDLGFTIVEEEVCGPDAEDACHSHQSDWGTTVDSPQKVAQIIEHLMGVAVMQRPDGEDWMWMPVALTTNEVVGLVGMGVPVEDEDGAMTPCTLLPPKEAVGKEQSAITNGTAPPGGS